VDFEPIEGMDELKNEFDDFFKEEMKKAPTWWSSSPDDLETEEGVRLARHLSREMGKRGWLCMGWPKKYGGLEKGILEQLAFHESMAYWRAPGWDIFGPGMVGPTLLAFGSEEQKERFLPPIARGEVWWAQLWSEPEAGSDLAAVQTFAKREGDDYIVNGQKVWTSGAHHSEWAFAVVRTSRELKRSRGLTYLLIDLKSPGITIRPLPTMSSYHQQVAHFNEIFLDDVRVPVANRVGEENEGWGLIRATMDFERALETGYFLELKRTLGELIGFCKETKWRGEPIANDPLVRNRLAQLAIDIEAGLASTRHILWGQYKLFMGRERDRELTTRSSSIKYYTTELHGRLVSTGMQILGLYGQLKRESKWAPLAGRFESDYQYVPGLHFAGGSTEVQKNIIAWEGLELPRT